MVVARGVLDWLLRRRCRPPAADARPPTLLPRCRVNESAPYSPDYEELEQALRAAEIDLSPAEVHGMVTATVSVPDARAPGSLFFGGRKIAPTPEVQDFLRLIAALQEDVRTRMLSLDFEFRPLLPPAGAELAEQVEGLAAWARGYTLGLGAAGMREPERLQGEVAEFLLDVTRIGEAEMDEDEPLEQQERELAEIVEYLRAGAQLVYDELHRMYQ